MPKKSAEHSFAEQLMTASKQFATIGDISILQNCCYAKANKYKNAIKKQLKERYIYPIPMSVVIEFFNIDVGALEKAAYREHKLFGNKKDA